jgi:hypothetical protein
MDEFEEKSNKHEKWASRFRRWVSIDEIQFEELGVFPFKVLVDTFMYMYFTSSYGNRSSWNNGGMGEYKEKKQQSSQDMSHAS